MTTHNDVQSGVDMRVQSGVDVCVQCGVDMCVQSGVDMCLHEHSWSQVLVSVPPVGGAGVAAACTQDALVQAMQLLPVLHRLKVGLHAYVL